MTKQFVSISDIANKLKKDPEIQKMVAKIKSEREESPARHNRKFNIDLMNYSAEINFHCQQIGYITNQILNNANEYSEEEINQLFKYRQKSIFDLARVQQKHDDLVRKLDLEIHNEDGMKLINNQ